MSPEEEKECHLQIAIAYHINSKALEAYKRVTLERDQGFAQKKALQLGRIMRHYLPIIIENKKKLKLQWGPDQKVLFGINKMFQNIN